MKFLYENFLQFYLLALTSIIQQILKSFLFTKSLNYNKYFIQYFIFFIII
ncbi:hypothetical protein [Spiroplasma endosymbiont of Nomada rufipes]